MKSSFSAQSSFSLQHFYKQLVYTEIKCYLWHISIVTYFFTNTFGAKSYRERERERFITSEIQCFRRSELPFKTVSMFQMKHSKWVQSLYTQLYQFMIRSNWGLLLILILIFFFWFVGWSFAFFFFFLRSIFLLV